MVILGNGWTRSGDCSVIGVVVVVGGGGSGGDVIGDRQGVR